MRTVVAVILILGLLIFNTSDLNKRAIGLMEYFLWQFGLGALLIFSLDGKVAQKISSDLGFTLFANFIFTCCLVCLLIVVRIQSRKISNLKQQIQEIVEKIAISDK